jgi:hypothetical protein
MIPAASAPSMTMTGSAPLAGHRRQRRHVTLGGRDVHGESPAAPRLASFGSGRQTFPR